MIDFLYVVPVSLVYVLFLVFLRFASLGMDKTKAFFRAMKFPLEVWMIHVAIYADLKAHDSKRARKVLFLPITDFPQVIVAIAEMYLYYDAMVEVFDELMEELSAEDKVLLIEGLVKKGYLVKKPTSKQPLSEIEQPVPTDVWTRSVYQDKLMGLS